MKSLIRLILASLNMEPGEMPPPNSVWLHPIDSTRYVGGMVIGKDNVRHLFEGGYAQHPRSGSSMTPTWHFFLRDHQGNVRVVCDGSGNVEQTNHYYPYGLNGQFPLGTGVQPYKYNGKELDRTHGLDLYDYGARRYDPALGRFMSIDPMYEKYYHLSPYAYCGGDPVNCIDINGDSIIIKMSLSQDQSIQLLYNYNENSFYDQQSGSLYNPNVDAPFYAIYKTVSDAFNNLSSTSAGDEVLHDLFVSDKYVYIRASGDVNTNGENVREDYQSVVSWNPFKDSAFGGGSCYSLIHELAHSQSRFNENMNTNTWYSEETLNGPVNIIYDEIYAIHVENMVRAENGAQL